MDPGRRISKLSSEEKKTKRIFMNKRYQQSSRLRKKETEIAEGKRDEVSGKPLHSFTPPANSNTTDMSIHTNCKLLRQKTKIEPKPQRVNWQHKLVWPHIHEAALRNGWRARAIVKDLELRYRQSGMFAQLHRSTVQNWIATDRRSWKSNVMDRVKEGRCWKPGTGRIQLLQPYPEIERSV